MMVSMHIELKGRVGCAEALGACCLQPRPAAPSPEMVIYVVAADGTGWDLLPL